MEWWEWLIIIYILFCGLCSPDIFFFFWEFEKHFFFLNRGGDGENVFLFSDHYSL